MKKGGGERFFWQIECKNKEIFKYHIWQLQEYSWPEKSKGFSEFIHEKLSEGIFAHHGLLCPCRAVFGNCYFWAIIDLPWCGRGTNKPLSWQVFILVKTAKISCVRLIAIAQEKTSTSQACSSRPKLIRQFSKMLEKRCLKQKFSQNYSLFASFFLLSRRALLSHDLTSFFNVQWWKFARWALLAL